MEEINLTSVFGHGPAPRSYAGKSEIDEDIEESTPQNRKSRRNDSHNNTGKATSSGPESISDAGKQDSNAAVKFAANEKNCPSNGTPERMTKPDLKEISKKRPPREPIDPRISVTGDSAPLSFYLSALFYPEVYTKIFYSLRTTIMVGLPLGLLERLPQAQTNFSAPSVLPLWGIVDCKYRTGEQIATSLASCQSGLFMMVWGTINNAVGLRYQNSAWWCSVLFSGFVLGLLGDVRARRLFLVQNVMLLQMEYLPGGTSMLFSFYIGRDFIMSTAFALVQAFFPPKTNAREVDEMIAKCFTLIYHVMDNCVKACWSDDPIDCALALRELSTEPIQDLINLFPSRAFFVMYEFWESTLRLELRKERMEYISRMVPFLHALTDCARGLATRRLQHMRVMKDEDKEKERYFRAERERRAEEAQMEMEKKRAEQNPNHEPFPVFTFHDQDEHRDHIRANSILVKNKNRPKLFHSDNDTELWERSREMLVPSVEHYLDVLKKVINVLNINLNPQDVTDNVPFDELKVAAEELFSNLNKVHFDILIKGDEPVNPYVYTNTIFFHVTLISIAERICEYGERMRTFERSRYKSQWVRIWEFFFYDYWRKFWEDLPNRLLIRTERDVRIIKDAIKMTCAYTVGAMYTQYMDPENIYYFGMCILMGVGLPTAGDTMVAAIYRITGMVCACSIAYVAIWHTAGVGGQLCISLAGTFIALLFRDVPPYSHTGLYCGMLILTCLNSASSKLELVSRIASNCFTVMTYYAICVLIFPIDVLKVSYNANFFAVNSVVERFSGLVDLALLPHLHSLSSDSSDEDDDHTGDDVYSHPEHGEKETLIKKRNKEAKATELRRDIRIIGQEQLKMLHAQRLPMWKAVNEFGTWVPKAAAHPTTHGTPYPVVAMKNVYSSLKRLASATDLLYVNLATLYQSDSPHFRPLAEGMVWAILPVLVDIDSRVRVLMQDFIDAIATPLEWDMEKVTRHFSTFLAIGSDLHSSFEKAHRRYVVALRQRFRENVTQRALEAAASSFCLPLDQLPNMHQMANESFAANKKAETHAPDMYTVEHGEGPSEENDSESVYGDDPLGQGRSRGNESSTGSKTISLGGGNSSTKEGEDDERASDAEDDEEEEEEHFQADSVARAVAFSIANTSFGFFGEGPGGNGAESLDSARSGRSLTRTEAADHAALKAKILPFTEMAENDEFHDFIRPKNQTFTANLEPERFSISHEVHVLISIMVATDMFFGESERMLKTMYEVNRYSRSRVAPGKRSIRDIADF